MKKENQGIPTACIGPRAAAVPSVLGAMAKATYVGIDFGTSTTVISIVRPDGEIERLSAKPIPITQWDDTGLQIDDHLLPTCLAWTGEQLLVGRGAADLKSELMEGRNIWSSFKMKLGIDLGPQYPNTKLARGQGPVVIERPQDAAAVFFSYIRESVENYIKKEELPPHIYYAVSVPAAFEANQRQDLINSLEKAGISVEESSLIDEPNAAFLSYLVDMEASATGPRFIDSLAERERRVMVFDFGAGTCDISVLEVKVENDKLSSRNLAISKFMALGGDDIDRAIAKNILLPQLCDDEDPEDIFTVNELETVILSRLKPESEALKVQCSKMAEDSGFRTPTDLRQHTAMVSGRPIPAIKTRKGHWELKDPHISFSEFADILEPFVSDPSTFDEDVRDQTSSVLEPITNALDKAGLGKDDLDMVLFIGGSSENPIVRAKIEEYTGRFVDCVTPRDLRSHVSQGAAIHSLFVNGLGRELIQPITSEPIYVITRNGGLQEILKAGTPVPTADITISEFTIDRDRQKKIELPLCVSGREKILAIISIGPAGDGNYFNSGEKIQLSCSITREKLLEVNLRIGDKNITAHILNPLANAEQTPNTRRLLQAKQALNESLLAGKGRPSAIAVLNYALAAMKAEKWREAAEMLEASERLDKGSDHATNITYCYSRGGDRKRSQRWSRIAHERSPSSMTAFNLALDYKRSGESDDFEELMEESLRLDPEYSAALNTYGHYLNDSGDPRGLQMIEKACALLNDELVSESLSENDIHRLRQAASTLGKRGILNRIKVYQEKVGLSDDLICEKYLVASSDENMLTVAR